MAANWISTFPRRIQYPQLLALVAFTVLGSGCVHVEGNYPPSRADRFRVSARFQGTGFQLLAGSRLRIDRVESDLEIIRSQGFSPRDPQIVKSVARRQGVPPALLADRSGNSYYRFTAHLDPGTTLNLTPGSLELTVKTPRGIRVTRDQGFVIEDRLAPGGCRPSLNSGLALCSPDLTSRSATGFLVRCPVPGEIVALALVPERCRVQGRQPPP